MTLLDTQRPKVRRPTAYRGLLPAQIGFSAERVDDDDLGLGSQLQGTGQLLFLASSDSLLLLRSQPAAPAVSDTVTESEQTPEVQQQAALQSPAPRTQRAPRGHKRR